MSERVRTAVIPAAGLGTRCLPASKAVPKEMMTVVDKPVIQYAVEEAFEAGIERVVLVTGRGKTAMEDHFDIDESLDQTLNDKSKTTELNAVRNTELDSGRLIAVRQNEAKGLGHAVWCARHVVGDQPFAVILPDDLVLAERGCLGQMLDVHDQVGGNLVAVQDVPREMTKKYGVLDVISEDGKLARANGLVEKPEPDVAPSTLAVIGRYVLQPEVMKALDDQGPGAGGEIQLTDALARLLGTQPFHGFRFDGTRYDCGDKSGFVEANVAFALQRADLGLAERLHALTSPNARQAA
ncbi:UTP--glucose-1-phosphate uridylyltransferase GalU [Rhodovibrio salinarum]|uniref:UTP--glucose-1-phosphate uridylyltransferase n=1 Tax=Rhodovibrio salinarum TaxID=1087 RepID=A0A934UYI9_9PROT|nr:UTP--glucose-1-phosphate uridylyltransferase GalU [Rhodovibrio salinarum]MBK1696162.1 UTP--glucose-1-phosphate uridylyltransferase [Rhodovibrio salinarum]